MKGALRVLIERLRHDALAMPRGAFEAGRSSDIGVLAAHPDVASVLAVLDDEAEATYPVRDALTRALIAQHHVSGDALWSSVLLVAFYPMLSHLRNRLICDALADDELDQLVVTSFLSTVRELAVQARRDRIAMRLRQRTARRVFASLRRERAEQHESAELEQLESEPDVLVSTSTTIDAKRSELQWLLQQAAVAGRPLRGFAVIAATSSGELLRSYVERMVPDGGIERERMYQRLKRQRSRVMARLKTMHSSASPVDLASP